MKEYFKLVFSLGLISTICTLILASAYELTKAPINAMNSKTLNEKLEQVLPPYQSMDPQVSIKGESQTMPMFVARNANNEVVGYAVQGSTYKGFSGEISILVGFNQAQDIVRVVTISHNETPGLGTVITDRAEVKNLWVSLGLKDASTLPVKSNFIDQFNGMNLSKSANAFNIKKDGGKIDAVSGATVSSVAVTDGVRLIAEALANHLKKGESK